MKNEIVINGNNICDISSFYKEINRVFMFDLDWQIAESLDAFDDLLYGEIGSVELKEETDLIWMKFEKNKTDLGIEATKEFYSHKIKIGHPYNMEWAKQKIKELENGTGQTFFEIVLEIISEHKNITLIPK